MSVVAVLAAVASSPGARADDPPPIAEALARCREVDSLPAGDKLAQLAILERGVALAEAAVAANPNDARAQLALGCNLGKQLDLAGISWRSLSRLNRLKAVIETAARLAPDDPDALVAKGELLHRVPSVLGGDVKEAEQYFRRALAAQPEHALARLYLAHLLADRDDPDARREAALAYALMQQTGTPRQQADAWQLFAQVRR
jgi:tetratricopeptide (TPR) repeat protein